METENSWSLELMFNSPQSSQNSKIAHCLGKASVPDGGTRSSFGAGRACEESRLFNGRERDDEPLTSVVLHIGVRWAMRICFFAGHLGAPSDFYTGRCFSIHFVSQGLLFARGNLRGFLPDLEHG